MIPVAELITIGAEVLNGSVLNSNACFLGCELSAFGFDVKNQVSCQDSRTEIRARLKQAVSRSDLIIMTGGLGPTPDDVTRDAVSDFFSVPLAFSRSQYRQIERHYQKAGRKVPVIVKREALFPENAVPLINRYGIALGFYIEHRKRLIVVLPGVPSELQKMYGQLVHPLLKKKFKRIIKTSGWVIKTVGISEPTVMRRLGPAFFKKGKFEFGIYPDSGEVTIRIRTLDRKLAKRLLLYGKRRLRGDVYAASETSLAEEIGRILTRKRKTLAVAESCTGGRLASELTRNAGASRYFRGGAVVYDNRIKEDWLGIPKVVLQKYGAVSEPVSKLMAERVRTKMKTVYGIGITGIAGPGGGSKEKPVGTVFLSLSAAGRIKTWRHEFWGDRSQIQVRAMKKALEHLWRDLQ